MVTKVWITYVVGEIPHLSSERHGAKVGGCS